MALNVAYAIAGTTAICSGIVMDEEVLVLICFVLFVGMAFHYGSSLVNDSIQLEASKMGKEFDAFFDLQKKTLKALINYHALQVLVISQVKELLEFSKGEIGKVISAKKLVLDATLATQTEQKLAYLASKEQAVAQTVQAEASAYVTAKINTIFTTDNKEKKALKEKILAENMKKLESLSA
jgi:hypothetical protein